MGFRVPFIKPDFPPIHLLGQDHQEIILNNWYTNFGPFERRFAAELASYIGQSVAVATVANATAGLMLALKALLRPKKGQTKVLVPSFTFAAGPEAILWCGFEPEFLDVEPDTWQPSLVMTRQLLEERSQEVAGILFCNSFGVGAPDIANWEKLCRDFNKPLIIDSAAGFGSAYPSEGLPLGARGDCEVFSFHATKPFGIGEGGGVSSTSKPLIDRLRRLQNFGFNTERQVDELGLNAKLSELSSAVGLRQLETLNERLDWRRSMLRVYKERLTPLGFAFQQGDELSTVPFVSCLSPTAKRAQDFYDKLLKAGIEAKRYYNPAVHIHPLFRPFAPKNLPVTDDICSRIVSLPVHDGVTKTVFNEIVEVAT